MAFSESTLADIRERMSITELVGEYVQLKKAGTGYLGLCPFHNEKSPSFHVHPMKQCFHCFGCHKGGNVFSFLCAIEGLSFPDAVKRLAKRVGVEIVEEDWKERRPTAKPEASKERERLLSALEWAAKYFHYLLMEMPEHRYAREYAEARGLTEKTLKKFRIGVSPRGWNTLMGLMRKRGYEFQELVQAGLVIEKSDKPGDGYDRFRERLMFPIADEEGNVVGFGARILKEDPGGTPQPKYLNSPESPIFAKRKILYGLYENQRGIRLRGEAVVVEGYMDVVGLHEAGVDNALATMGTAFTEEHCYPLKKLTKRVVTVFDPDRAGVEAWHRSVHVFLAAGVFAKDLSLPDGLDPDEFVQKESAEAFYKLCERAPRQVTKLLKEIASRGPLGEEESGRLLQELSPVLVASRNLPDRALLWDDISLVLKVSLGALRGIVDTAVGRTKREEAPRPAASAPRPGPPPKPKLHPDPLGLQFFEAALRLPDEFRALPREKWWDGIKDARLQEHLGKLHASSVDEWDRILGAMVQDEATDLQAAASAGLLSGAPDKDAIAGFQALAARVEIRKKELEIRAVSAQVRLAQRLGNEAELVALLERLKTLRSASDEKR